MLLHRHDDDDISKLETRLLISCPREGPGFGGFYELDLKTNAYRQLFECDGRGMTAIPGGILAGSLNDGWFKFDHDLNIIQRYPLPYHDQHGMEIGLDGTVYAVETARNRIGFYHLDPFERFDEIVISFEDYDHNHVNDIKLDGDRMLVSMFSAHGAWRTNWKNNAWDGAIVEYDLQSKKLRRLIAGALRMPHTVRIFNDRLHFCESFNLNVTVDSEILAQFTGYTRGLAFDGRFYYIGQSRMRHWGKHKEPNLSADAGVHVMDTTNRLTRFIPVPTKQVYDIVIVGPSDAEKDGAVR